MKIFPNSSFADAKDERRQGERAFTMVEIAIAIGVIGFALVAVIGILPTGMNTQKDNREDTAIAEDAPFFIDAIKNGISLAAITNSGFVAGNRGLDFLTNYVEKIQLITIVNGQTNPASPPTYENFQNGAQIIGLLSRPSGANANSNNYVINRATVRALGGAAVQQNGANQITAFRYQMDVQVVPFNTSNNVAPDSIAFNNYEYGTPDYIIRSNRWLEVTPGLDAAPAVNMASSTGMMNFNLFTLKLHFNWPVLPNGAVSVAGHQTYQSLISSAILAPSSPSFYSTFDGVQLWFFQPQLYASTNDL